MSYLADVTVRITLTREPSDAEAEVAAEALAKALKGVTVGSAYDGADGRRTRIGISNAEVIDWDGEAS